MPFQSNAQQVPPISSGRVVARRVIFFGSVLLVNAIAVLWLADLFWAEGSHRAHVPLLIIFAILNGLLVLGSFHAFFGAIEMALRKRHAVSITHLAGEATQNLKQRYAVVMPVYNEDSGKFCARIEAIYRSIKVTGHLGSFDFFLLSDTRDLDLWIIEETAWANLCRRLDGFGKIYYRRRRTNDNRKAGNIGDFVRKWGGRYEGMLVLDADSLMDGRDIVRMARVMEAHPKLGILQTPPKLIRGTSVFTRLQQFAMSIYGPLFIRGLNFWQLSGGSYWGHNAMIRVQPFSEFCELPALPGREPFGGRILSHDFVEAALMVSQGWEVWLAWDLEGTYEEAPPTLIDHLKRDRRWCQGNLQHLWLIFARKLPLTVRIHLFMGIMAYLGGPLWFLFLVLGTWLAWDYSQSNLTPLPFDGFAERWFGIGSSDQGLILVIFVAILLFLPKILAVLRAIFVPSVRQSFGGVFAILKSAFLETSLSVLFAPVMMLAHSFMVLSIMSGKAVGWGNQNREADGTAWIDALRFHAAPTLAGILWTILALKIETSFAIWMSPILAGLVLSVPLSVWTSRTKYGAALKKAKVLLTPDEIAPPEILKLALKGEEAEHVALNAESAQRRGVVAAIVDPYVNGIHLSLLENAEMNSVEEALAIRCLKDGPDSLTKEETGRLLYLLPAMLMAHRKVWLGNEDEIHEVWKTAIESYRIRSSA